MNRTEYEKEQKTAHALDYLKREVLPLIPVEIRPFFQLKYCEGAKLPPKPIEALIEAIQVFSSHVNVSKKCTIYLGDSNTFCFNSNPCGRVTYEQKPEFMATTFMGHNIVFLNLQILSQLPLEVCIAGILEEFVHSFFDIQGHPLANHIVLLLYPKVQLNERGEYHVAHEDHMPCSQLSQNQKASDSNT